MRIMCRRHRPVHGMEHAFILLRSGDREHAGVLGSDLLGLGAHAAGNDDFSVLRHRRFDRGKRFSLSAVKEPASIDDSEVGAGVLTRQLVTLGSQTGDDALGIDQRLWAAERDKGNTARTLHYGFIARVWNRSPIGSSADKAQKAHSPSKSWPAIGI